MQPRTSPGLREDFVGGSPLFRVNLKKTDEKKGGKPKRKDLSCVEVGKNKTHHITEEKSCQNSIP